MGRLTMQQVLRCLARAGSRTAPGRRLRIVHNAKIGLRALATLGLTGWFGYAVVVGVLGSSGGRVGAGFGAAVSLAMAVWSGSGLIRLTRPESRAP